MADQAAGRSKVERIKEASHGLRGTIRAELLGDAARFGPESIQLLKFHGIYQQDDRDQRRQLKGAGKEVRTIFMVRTKNPGGGALSPEQWAVLDRAGDLHGDGTLRVTTRQDIQFHGVGKDNLRALVRLLNGELISTYGACGDGNRNTCACPVSEIRRGAPFGAQALARRISARLGFNSNAYYEIWLRDEEGGGSTPFVSVEEEPLYGPAYMPRKFKIGVALPDDNCIDVHTHDVGVVPLFDGGRLRGFNLLAGGGLGSTHAKPGTYPRLADPIAFLPADEERLVGGIVAILELQRDHGGRSDRRHARLKYLIDDRGLPWFRDELQRRAGAPLTAPEPMELRRSEAHLGVHEQHDGRFYLGLFVENGRIADRDDVRLKSGLREIVRQARPNVRLTATQDLILSDMTRATLDDVLRELAVYGIRPEERYSALRKRSMACPALPTCGLAITEAERYLPRLLDDLEALGCGGEAVTIRMSGCPNACSRPSVAEIGLVGRSLNSYTVSVGGSPVGTRLATTIGDNVPAAALAPLIGALIDAWRRDRGEGEPFGDFVNRRGAATFAPLAGALATAGRSAAAPSSDDLEAP